MKKVAVLNYTGTVGKTTVAAHLLAPRMDNAPIYAIEALMKRPLDWDWMLKKFAAKTSKRSSMKF